MEKSKLQKYKEILLTEKKRLEEQIESIEEGTENEPTGGFRMSFLPMIIILVIWGLRPLSGLRTWV